MNRIFFLIGLVVSIFALDQATKIWAASHITNTIEVTSFFNLVLTLNRGVSFAMFTATHAYGVYLLIGLTSLLSLLVLYLVITSKEFFDKFAFSMIFAGAIGNLFDRIRLGGVIDFLDFHIMGHHWPAFNVADSAICIGVGLLFFNQFIVKKNQHV